MIPFYDFSIDCWTNIKKAYDQGANDMRKKIYYEISKNANTEKDFELLLKVRNMEINDLGE